MSYRPQRLGEFGKNLSVFGHGRVDLDSCTFDCADAQGASWHLGLAETWLRTWDGPMFDARPSQDERLDAAHV